MKYFLIILDGWGLRKEREYNAIALGNTPTFDYMMEKLPNTTLVTYGERVGLPEGQMGNSEVGHLNIGAGRVVYQEITKINKAIKTGDFFKNPVLIKAIEKAKSSKLHLMGLLSDGGVHSHQKHLYALLEMSKHLGLSQNVYVHAFMDGRDTSPEAGVEYMDQLIKKTHELGVGKVATISGRYYAMDRDKRWDRTERAYSALVYGEGKKAEEPIEAIKLSYSIGITDEFIEPMVIVKNNIPIAKIEDNDVVIFFNFRADRARQLSHALNDSNFKGFRRRFAPRISYFTFTEYDAKFNFPVCFPPQSLKNILAEVFYKKGIKNLRLAETEKYAHVTFFFNGGVEKAWPGERRILIPSPKVATYDLKPEMSAPEVAQCLIEEIDKNIESVFIINFANSDMVGHTGVLKAAIKAVETVDQCIGKIFDKIKKDSHCLLLTADHGNSELMWDYATNGPHTAHTTNPVPFIVYHPDGIKGLKNGGALEDIAPTLLEFMGLEKPEEMTGNSLIL